MEVEQLNYVIGAEIGLGVFALVISLIVLFELVNPTGTR